MRGVMKNKTKNVLIILIMLLCISPSYVKGADQKMSDFSEFTTSDIDGETMSYFLKIMMRAFLNIKK